MVYQNEKLHNSDKMSTKFSISDLQSFAREKNSLFLSDEYINGTTKYQWQCSNGHIFERTWAEARKCPDVRWCQECKKGDKIELLREYARERSGKCLSEVYQNDKTHYEWECKNGHRWFTNWNTISRKKSWCGKCRKYTIQDLQQKAKENGGKCLSKEYVNDQTYYEWKCKNGHHFKAVWSSVNTKNSWCRACIKDTICIIKKYARNKGGDCLSEKYITSRDKYVFICSNKHIWETQWSSMKHNNSWCKECQKYTISELQKRAEEKGGRVHSSEYINKNTQYEWECKKGHRWLASWDNVLYGGTWCRECSYASRTCKNSKKYTIFDLQIVASEKGGLCLSEEYISADKRYTWKCKNNHTWKTSFGNVFYNGTWCPQCQKLSLKEAQKIAREREGRCLSEYYINKRENMEWECKKGHRWFSTLGSIKYDKVWCTICWHGKSRPSPITIDQLKEIVEKKGGKLIATEYKNPSTKLTVICSKNHIWETTSMGLKNGNWCFECCVDSKFLTIEEVQETATKRKGRLISAIYEKANKKVIWECKNKHQWSATTSSVRNGSWCPYCRYKSEQLCREILEKIYNDSFPKIRPKFLKTEKGGYLELDGYNKELDLAFEYQGIQHEEVVPFFHPHGEKDLLAIQERDKIKREKCSQNGICLLEIPSKYSYNHPKKLKLYIRERLVELDYLMVVEV
jgi:thiol-disulfide isomerase/thioredoxin